MARRVLLGQMEETIQIKSPVIIKEEAIKDTIEEYFLKQNYDINWTITSIEYDPK